MKGGLIRTGIIIVAVVLFTTHCAKQATPTGGLKDVTPPVILKSIPESGSTGFTSKSINITFDEYFVLEKQNEKFLMSPPSKTKPKITVKGKSLNIEFMDKLKDSTTYTLNFPDVIRDLNEGNPIPNLQYVFSTGKFLDSLSVAGNVVDAQNLEAGSNILVMLYGNLNDTAPRKMLPDYVTVADANGYFRINNIRKGSYRMFALSDKNNNNRYDPPDEPFAFSDSVIFITPEKDYRPPAPVVKDTVKKKKSTEPVKVELPFFNGDHKLYMFTAEKKNHYLASSDRKVPYQFLYYLSLPPDTMKFSFSFPGGENYRYYSEKSRQGDTIAIWLRDSSAYYQPTIKTLVTYPFTDSLGNNKYRSDTIAMRFTIPKPGKVKPAWKVFKLSENISGSMKPGQKIVFTSSTPMRTPDTSKIKLYQFSGKSKIRLPVTFIKDTSDLRKVTLGNEFKTGERYQLIRDKGSFGNIYGDQSDSSALNISVRQPDSYGHLTVFVQNGKGNLIVQLLSQKENVLDERRLVNSGKADFPLLEPGMYRMRVIYDMNGDGKWTPGNFLKLIQPEPVSYFPKEIEVKTNWDIEEEWDVSTFHVKPQTLREKKEAGK